MTPLPVLTVEEIELMFAQTDIDSGKTLDIHEFEQFYKVRAAP